MTKSKLATDRPMPPRPAAGGTWRFDPDEWAYVQVSGPVEATTMLTRQVPVDTATESPVQIPFQAPVKEV